jgi:dynein heavy chain 2
VTPWLPFLEKELKSLNPHKDFRLWLTTEAHPKFPPMLLQSSVKVTYEAPPGIKKNLQRAFQSNVAQSTYNNPTMLSAYFALSWFHALVQERRTYIPQAWTKFYEFSYGDLKAGEEILCELISKPKMDWETYHGLMENAVYGGRVDNEFDIKTLCIYIKQIFNSQVVSGAKQLYEGITIPQNPQIRDIHNIINSLPDHDNPLMFGLPPTIDKSVQRFNSIRVINTLKLIQLPSSENVKFDKDKWSVSLTPIVKLWTSSIKIEDFMKYKINSEMLMTQDPLEAFVYMEYKKMQELMMVIQNSILEISQVINATGVIKSSTEKNAGIMLKGGVPECWSNIWDGPSSTVQYIRQFAKKTEALTKILSKVAKKDILTEVLSFSDFFNPQTLLNVFRQKVARTSKSPIDTLKLAVSFEETAGKHSHVLHIRDLWIQGASIEGGRLVDSKDSKQELMEVPVCHLIYIPPNNEGPYSSKTTMTIPIYYTLSRESLLCKIEVPQIGSTDSKIISGSALFVYGSD